MGDLADITERLGEHYRRWKAVEKMKNTMKEEFFKAAKVELEQSLPAQSVQEIEAASEEEMLRICQRRYVRHNVVSYRQNGDGSWAVVLEEDPELRPFTYVNPTDGYVYSKIISEGSPILDDEGLQEQDPELYEQITKEVVKRELISPEEWTPEQVERLQPYITMPKPQVRLGAPRKAKDEELE